jgi:hypothetical protein
MNILTSVLLNTSSRSRCFLRRVGAALPVVCTANNLPTCNQNRRHCTGRQKEIQQTQTKSI